MLAAIGAMKMKKTVCGTQKNKCIGNRRCIGIINLNCDDDRFFNCWDAIYENTAINSDDSEKNCFLKKNERFGK